MLSEKDWKPIRAHPLLSGVPYDQICRTLERHGDGVFEFLDGDALENGSRIGFLLSGRAIAQTTDESRHVLLRNLSAGDVFGVAGMFSDAPQVSHVFADGTCKCIFFSENAVAELFDESDTFRKNYVVFLSDRIRFLNRKITYLTAGCAERRLALYLLSLGSGEVELKDSISSLSELLNLGRASLYRAFEKLCQDGFLQKNGRKLTILNAEAMLNAYK